eukprot:CAMPEP_0179191282 /NCGR_PEP_ID=MMETSP0796-20121207/95004_1 /TAXON_ID=73915 /ORGANISM="Pyrodinium bahamense, Strain pbaha01" /LENGTH=74 /DNA_ID=CAMNT_0020895497 /DNA_START=227 /DNA_END=451 /DNA_ORIENTATION=-
MFKRNVAIIDLHLNAAHKLPSEHEPLVHQLPEIFNPDALKNSRVAIQLAFQGRLEKVEVLVRKHPELPVSQHNV